MYDGRGFALPGTPEGASPYLAQHDFVHVLADYGTNLKGELEVFALIGRADPDPKGFAWLATLIGLFETGYVEDTGFFERDVREHNIQAPGMHVRIADAIRRGKVVCERCGTDLFDVDYHALAAAPGRRGAARSSASRRSRPARSSRARPVCSIARACPRYNRRTSTSAREAAGEVHELHPDDLGPHGARGRDRRAAREWDEKQAEADVMGYIGSHVLARPRQPRSLRDRRRVRRGRPRRLGGRRGDEEQRPPETQEWARRLLALIDGAARVRQLRRDLPHRLNR